MKTFIATIVLISSFTLMASTIPCKSEAHIAVAKQYSSENPGVSIFLKAKYKPVLEEKIVYHMVEILESEATRVSLFTVSLDPKTCSVLSID